MRDISGRSQCLLCNTYHQKDKLLLMAEELKVVCQDHDDDITFLQSGRYLGVKRRWSI